ncbi:UNVERIFIED_CONTAM: hypothetical protein Sindi_1448200 [Sesamum indicum]
MELAPMLTYWMKVEDNTLKSRSYCAFFSLRSFANPFERLLIGYTMPRCIVDRADSGSAQISLEESCSGLAKYCSLVILE